MTTIAGEPTGSTYRFCGFTFDARTGELQRAPTERACHRTSRAARRAHRTTRRTRDARGPTRPPLARRHFRRFRARPDRGREQAARGACDSSHHPTFLETIPARLPMAGTGRVGGRGPATLPWHPRPPPAESVPAPGNRSLLPLRRGRPAGERQQGQRVGIAVQGTCRGGGRADRRGSRAWTWGRLPAAPLSRRCSQSVHWPCSPSRVWVGTGSGYLGDGVTTSW